MYFNQADYDIRCEWGLEGIKTLVPTSCACVIIDVFSFTTCVDAALSRGASVYPYRGPKEDLVEFAHARNAILATFGRKAVEGYSLTPSSLLRLPSGGAVVLPSPNGSTLSLATGNVATFAGCLRNARAVAEAAQMVGKPISVIPAGERWPDGSLRPGLEDLIGAGAVIHYLTGTRSPEAETAESVFLHFRERLLEILATCSSGKEAGDQGSPEDVRLAAELNISQIAPRLMNGRYEPEAKIQS